MVKFVEHIQSALNVSGYHPCLKFDDDIFLLDYWDDSEGLKYLIGIALFTQCELTSDFSNLTTLESEIYDDFNDEDILLAFRHVWHRLNRLWLSNAHAKSNPPSYYIEWAISKGIEIPWLNYAIEKGFYKPKINNEIDKPLSNTERDTLLVIIAALAKEAKVDILKTSKAGDLIANMTQLMGVPIGATTIETHLKKINKAIANRTK